MAARRSLVALGLMSGTSLDGIDAAILRTDGERVDGIGPTATVPYYNAFRARLRALLGRADGTDAHLKGVVRDLTVKHAMAVRYLLASHRVTAAEVDVIGFHGHTILHRPDERLTCQIGDGPLLARLTGIPVVNDFRSRDVAEGGQGAPLAPLYHAALARDLDRPLAVLNLGGVANVTWLGTGSEAEGDIIAFDVGPGNAMIDDWMLKTTGRALDDRGAMAATGRVDWAALERLLEHPFFAQRPPKTLDRNTFACDAVDGLAPADGAATLTAFTVAAAPSWPAWRPSSASRWSRWRPWAGTAMPWRPRRSRFSPCARSMRSRSACREPPASRDRPRAARCRPLPIAHRRSERPAANDASTPLPPAPCSGSRPRAWRASRCAPGRNDRRP